MSKEDAACWGLYHEGIDMFDARTARKYASLCTGCEWRDECDAVARELYAEWPRFFKGMWGGKLYRYDYFGKRTIEDLS